MRELVFAVIFLMILFLVLYPLRFYKKPEKTKIEKRKTCIIFGATNIRGRDLALKLSEEYQVIVVSRRESKFLDIYSEYPEIKWLEADIRLNRTIDRVFELVRENVGEIDLVINLAVIHDDRSFTEIPSERHHDDIYLKLQGAYTLDYPGMFYRRKSPGSEYWFFTNIIGGINVYSCSKKYKVKNLVLLDTDLRLLSELYDSFVTENIVDISLIKIENILDILPASFLNNR